ncbi:MAG: MBL fold metallo-hydrolase [Candidatus Thorarchaeota archaeon]
MAELTFLGSCREIGRSGFLLTVDGESLLVDYGVKFQDNPLFPARLDTDDLQGVVLTHAHLDHSGAIPLLLNDEDLSLFCTPATSDLSSLLIEDMFSLSGGRLPFDREDISRVRTQCQFLRYGETVSLGRKFEVTLFNAGHIPGSAMVSVKYNGKRILFTGDFNTIETRLSQAASRDLPSHDYVVTEATYARQRYPARDEIEQGLLRTVVETMQRGGSVLIPAFAVGRSQEILCVLAKHGIMSKYPVYVDGMARHANEILLHHPESLRAPQEFEQAVRQVRVISTDQDRIDAIRGGSIIVSPAGMLKGGASFSYFKMMHGDSRHALVMVSFQVPGTPGAELLAHRRVTVANRTYNVSADVCLHHLSSHSDSRGLMDMLLSQTGNPTFYIVHAESDSCEALAQELKSKGKMAYIPERNESVEV